MVKTIGVLLVVSNHQHAQFYIHTTDMRYMGVVFQADLCRKVIRLCQDLVVGSILDKATWDFVLSVLLYHTWRVFTRKDSSLARELAAPLLKVSWYHLLLLLVVVFL